LEGGGRGGDFGMLFTLCSSHPLGSWSRGRLDWEPVRAGQIRYRGIPASRGVIIRCVGMPGGGNMGRRECMLGFSCFLSFGFLLTAAIFCVGFWGSAMQV
jgi:hypothetical protein